MGFYWKMNDKRCFWDFIAVNMLSCQGAPGHFIHSGHHSFKRLIDKVGHTQVSVISREKVLITCHTA